MNYISRTVEAQLAGALARGRSVLLLGPRQTGKTTLAQRLNPDMQVSFIRPDVRQRYERRPELHGSVRHGLVICRTPQRFRLARDIVALPWQEIPTVIEEFLA